MNVSFLPDRERLALVARDIQASRRAFPLIHIANLFLGGDDRYLVKLELPPPKQEGEPRKLFAWTATGRSCPAPMRKRTC